MVETGKQYSSEGSSETDLVAARLGLHAVAEQLLAGPQWRTSGTIRLAVTLRGFATTRPPAKELDSLEVRADGLFTEPDAEVIPLTRSINELARLVEVNPGPPTGVYPPATTLPPDQRLDLPRSGVNAVLAALTVGDQALRALVESVGADKAGLPVLWPEHFDLGLSLDEVNYGVSPGDDGHPRPYAYVGPWSARSGEFWNESFGASRSLDELGDAAAITAFLLEGRARAAEDPPA